MLMAGKTVLTCVPDTLRLLAAGRARRKVLASVAPLGRREGSMT